LKAFWRFYAITTVILIAVSAVPIWNFATMLLTYYQERWRGASFSWSWINYDVTVIIPFMPVLTAVIIGFLFLPALLKMSGKKRAIVSAGATGIFLGLEIYAARIAARLNVTGIILSSRMPRDLWTPEVIAGVTSEVSIPWQFRVHYYIFSIILILATLNFLYCLANALYRNEKPDKAVILNGIATACYALAYVFVRPVQFHDHGDFVRIMRFHGLTSTRLTGLSVFNTATCFVFGSITVGLFCGSFFRFEGLKRFIPSLASIITVLALYTAQYFMLDGNFYSYHNNIVVTIFLRALIILCPAVSVYLLLRKSNTNREKTVYTL